MSIVESEHPYVSLDFAHRSLSDRKITKDDEWRRIKSALTNHQWECLRLCIVDGESQADVAKLLGISQPSVCLSIERAIDRIKSLPGIADNLQSIIAADHAADPKPLSRVARRRDDKYDCMTRGQQRGTWDYGKRDDA